jgi:hypothetical protein
MRILMLSALLVLAGSSAFAQGGHSDWRYRPRRPEIHQSRPDPDFRTQENRHHPRYVHRRSWARRPSYRPHPEPPVVHLRPLPLPPPPPPIGIHLWFGF